MSPRLKTFLQSLQKQGIEKTVPNISFFAGEILQFFCRISGAEKIFEIGSANGFSTIFFADAVRRQRGKVVTCDVSEPSFREARENIKKANLAKFVEFRFGDGCTIPKPSEKFDCVFIDAQKNRTAEFFRVAERHLVPNGLILIDNTTRFPEKMEAFYALRKSERHFVFFDIAVSRNDALTVAFRKQ